MLLMLFVMIMSVIYILMLMMRAIRMQGVRREALERSQVLLPVSVGYGGGAGRVAKEKKRIYQLANSTRSNLTGQCYQSSYCL